MRAVSRLSSRARADEAAARPARLAAVPGGAAHRGARAPYFHNGAAATLLGVVNFCDQRFAIGLLFAFLNSL
jgi:cytochrome c peroxidase